MRLSEPSGRSRRRAVLPNDLLRQLLETWITGRTPQFFPWHCLQDKPRVMYQVPGFRIERPSGLVDGMFPGPAVIQRHLGKYVRSLAGRSHHGRPELKEQYEDRVGAFLLRGIWTEPSEPLCSLFAAQAGDDLC